MLQIKMEFPPKRVSQVRETQCVAVLKHYLYRISGIQGFKSQDVRILAVFIWFRTRSRKGVLWTRHWSIKLHKRTDNFLINCPNKTLVFKLIQISVFLVNDQRDAQILFYVFIFIYNSLHASSTSCSSSGETNCINTASGNSHSVLVAALYTGWKKNAATNIE